MRRTNEEKNLLARLKAGEFDGLVGDDLWTSGGSRVWTVIKDGSLMQEPGDIIPADDTSINVLRLNHHDRGSNFRDMLAAAVQMFNAADIIGKIQKGTEFVVQVPAQYQPELEAGAVQMMHGGKSGKTRATLVRKLADGKQEIVCNCPIKEEIRIQGTPIQNLTGIYQNLYFQQKLSELSAQVQEVYNAVLRIEQGQMDDRIGKLISGRNDVQLALQNSDIEGRKREMELARSKISVAQSQIGQLFKSRIEDFEPIPKSEIKQWLKEMKSLTTTYKKKSTRNSKSSRNTFCSIFEQHNCWRGHLPS